MAEQNQHRAVIVELLINVAAPTIVLPETDVATALNSSMPRSSVVLNDSSSFLIVVLTRSCFAASSGNTAPISATNTSTSS